MAGYTRQSAASIINGENITAPPINAEFNTLQNAFHGTTGHAHDGTTGNGPKIDLATSVSGFLPSANGGLGGKNNYAASSDPTVGDDTNDGYAVGSAWYNVSDDRYYICVYNAAGAAVWLENRFINSSGDFAPHANNTKDLGHTLKRWKDLFLSGNADIDGSLNVATTTYLGGILTVNANAIFNVGTTTTISNIDVASGAIDNAAIGTTVAAAGTFTTLSATTSLTAATADINGGSIDGATVGANSHSTGKFTTLQSTGLATLNSVNVDGGAIDGTVIGATTPAAGSFTTISSAGQATLASVDINGGSIDGTTIGATSASPITGTTITGTSLVGPVTGNITGNTSGTHTGPVTGAVTGNLTGNVTSSGTSTFNNVTIDGTLNMNAGTSATITNLSAPTNDNDAARKVDVDNAVANLVDSAPGTLDTLNELAAALGDDPDFATTITNSIATKLPLSGGTMTGAIAMSTNKITGVGDPTAAQDVSSKAYVDQQDGLQVTKTGDSMSGNLAMGSNNITGLATPTANDHASNKSYVDGILGSGTAASASAAAAATSESNAATSETNAANSATAAASSATSAAASLDSFDDRYLGAKSAAPAVDNDGDALIIGALYFDTTAGAMKVYSANGWTNAGSSVNGTTNRYNYTATAGQTVFAATYDAGYVDVFLNGVKQLVGTDVTATSGTSVVFASGTTVNDIVEIVGYGTFVLADHLTQTQSDARYVNLSGDTMTGNLSFGDNNTARFGDNNDLTVDHTGSSSRILNNTGNLLIRSNEADSDVRIQGDDQNGSYTEYFQANGGTGAAELFFAESGNSSVKLKTTSTGVNVTGTVTADKLNVTHAGGGDFVGLFQNTTSATPYGVHIKDAASGANGYPLLQVTNSAGSSPYLLVHSGTGRVGIGTNSPAAALDVNSGNENVVATFTSTDTEAQINLVDTTGSAQIRSRNDLRFFTNGGSTRAMDIASDGTVFIGKTSADLSLTGIQATSSGQAFSVTRDGGAPFALNRKSSDGEIAGFYKDTVKVGSIACRSSGGNLQIHTNQSGIDFGGDGLLPMRGSSITDNSVNIGQSSYRFKDAYLSGGVFLGGTGVANKLHDYEEGSWTPVIGGSSSTSGQSYSVQLGTYTKIGNAVHLHGYVAFTTTGTMSGSYATIQGLPFSVANNSGSYAAVNVGYYSGLGTNVTSLQGYTTVNGNFAYLKFSTTGTATTYLTPAQLGTGPSLIFSITYNTNS